MKYKLVAHWIFPKRERVIDTFATKNEALIAKRYYDKFSDIPHTIELLTPGEK
jgi:hypothetical protein